MVKKVKLLFILMALTALGIVLVLGFWLAGSYQNRQELFLSSAERMLFNVVQSTVQADDSLNFSGPGGPYPSHIRQPHRRPLPRPERRDERSAELFDAKGPRHILPPFLFGNRQLSTAQIETIRQDLAAAFKAKGYPENFSLQLARLSRQEIQQLRKGKQQHDIVTRPLMVNPDKHEFLLLRFSSIRGFLWFHLSGYLLTALLLVGMLISTFVFLLRTIMQQNKLAVLRKSFVNNMTHELKTPVSTVMAAIEAIQMYVKRDDRVKMERYLDISKRELVHLHTLIERVLEVDVDEFSGVKIHKSKVVLQDILRDAISPMEVHASKDIQIVLDIPEEPITLTADAAHLKNVFSNLLDNAIKYADQSVHITIQVLTRPLEVELIFRDNGKGISTSDQALIFDLFYRVPEGNLHEVKGFGIGLSYVKQIVEKHGGHISVQSELKKGSTFTLIIPKSI